LSPAAKHTVFAPVKHASLPILHRMMPRAPIDPLAPLAWLRSRLAHGIRSMVGGDRPAVRDLARPVEGDPGLFGPDSVVWRVHQDASMLVGGLRALLLQTMHPLAMAGIADHSNYRHDPIGRLHRTSAYVGTTTYGTRAQARAAIDHVRQVHRRVVGVTPEGRPYAANDPHLLTWVHHTLVDSFLRAHRRYGSERLHGDDTDRYVEEMAVLAELWDAEPAARSRAELRAYFDQVRPELRATRAARDAARWLVLAPLPLPTRPAYAIVAPAAVGLLPGWVRSELRLPVLPGVDPLLVRPAATATLRALDWVMGGLEQPDDQPSAPPSPSATSSSPA
jgi:uncharacterized protein (DUF2236 family)